MPEKPSDDKIGQRGGRRENAGRKAYFGERLTPREVRLTKAQIAHADAQPEGLAGYIRRLIDQDRGVTQ